MLSFWTLLLAPFLCGVGVLVHSCICDTLTECHHELSCSADPCLILAVGVRPDDNHQDQATSQAGQPDHLVAVLPALSITVIFSYVPVAPVPVSQPLLIAADGSLPLLC